MRQANRHRAEALYEHFLELGTSVVLAANLDVSRAGVRAWNARLDTEWAHLGPEDQLLLVKYALEGTCKIRAQVCLEGWE